MVKKLRVRNVEDIESSDTIAGIPTGTTYSGKVVIDVEAEFGDFSFSIPFERQPTIDAGIEDALETFEGFAEKLKEAAARAQRSKSHP
jgi:hypothetical protein